MTTVRPAPVDQDGNFTDPLILDRLRETLGGGTGSTPSVANHAGIRNTVRRDAFTARRGGRIGTGGRPVVCIRVDHNTTNLRDKVAPLARQYGLPLSLAVYGDMNERFPATHGMTWAEIQAAAVNEGWEVWNHSATHQDATGTEALTTEIVTARDTIAARLPRSVVEGFVIPGVTGSSQWGGFINRTDTLRFSDTEAGRLIHATHAVCTSNGGRFFPLAGRIPGDVTPQWVDELGTSSAKTIVQQAQERGVGVCLALHPNNVDTASGPTAAALGEFFGWLAAERDAGRLEILTMGGAMLADAGTTYRHNLLVTTAVSSFFSSTGWTHSGGVFTGTSSAGLLRQPVTVDVRHEYALGGLYELYAEVQSADGAVAGLRAVDGAATPVLNATRDFTIPASTTAWTPVRLPVTIPTNATYINAHLGRVSGGALSMRNLGFRAV